MHVPQKQTGAVTEAPKLFSRRVVLSPGLATIGLLLWACTSDGPRVGSDRSEGGGASGGAASAASAGLGGSIVAAGNSPGAAPGSGGANIANAGNAGTSGTAGGAAGSAGQPQNEQAWPAVNDYAAVGPFETIRDQDSGPDGTFDVFRPVVLGESDRRHPIISWANGTLFSLDDYQSLLTHWASHGFVVVASHSNSTAGGVTHKAGIDWLVAQNEIAQSIYFEVLDPSRIAAAGHSQGGGATIAAGAGEPAPSGVITTLPLMPIPNFEADLTILGRQLVPMFSIVATEEDRDPLFAGRLFQEMNAELVQATYIGVHEDAMNPAMAAPTLAWFRLRLMSDATAGGYFYPPDTCLLCTDAGWESVVYKP